MNKHRFFILIVVVLIVAAFLFQKNRKRYLFNEGYIHGTIYHINYETPAGKNLKLRIDKLMQEVDMSLSTYKENSVISRFNANDSTARADRYFKKVFRKAMEVSEKTNGAFDITVAPLVNAWGFGFEKMDKVDSLMIDSLMQYIGYQKVRLIDEIIYKDNPGIKLDLNAIAKGYSVDIIANYLESREVKNYMVEIGGEVSVKGVNTEGNPWRIGIDKPIEDPSASEREIQDIIVLHDKAIATSGNYRNFYEKDGRKYSHTISPKTGYPVRHELLSASVISDQCMTADAYATAFMVLGLKESIKIANKTENLEAYFIYADENGEMKTYYTKGVEDILVK